MQFSVVHSSCMFLVEYLAVRIFFSAFTSSTAVSGPFGIASSLKCFCRLRKIILMAGRQGFEPWPSGLEPRMLPLHQRPIEFTVDYLYYSPDTSVVSFNNTFIFYLQSTTSINTGARLLYSPVTISWFSRPTMPPPQSTQWELIPYLLYSTVIRDSNPVSQRVRPGVLPVKLFHGYKC